jgi:hypothetical protein
VLIFFIAGLLFAPRAHRSLGAYRIPLETGLLIPSDKRRYRKLTHYGITGTPWLKTVKVTPKLYRYNRPYIT